MYIQMYSPDTWYGDIELADLKDQIYITMSEENENKLSNEKEYDFSVRPINLKQVPTNTKDTHYKENLFDSLEFEMSDSVMVLFKGKAKLNPKLPNNVLVSFIVDSLDLSDFSKKKAQQVITMVKRYFQSEPYKNRKKLYKKAYHNEQISLNHSARIIDNLFSSDDDLPF